MCLIMHILTESLYEKVELSLYGIPQRRNENCDACRENEWIGVIGPESPKPCIPHLYPYTAHAAPIQVLLTTTTMVAKEHRMISRFVRNFFLQKLFFEEN